MARTKIPTWKDSDAILDISNFLRDNKRIFYRPIDLVEERTNIFRSSRKQERYSTVMHMVGLLRIARGVNLIHSVSGRELGREVTKYFYQPTSSGHFSPKIAFQPHS